ncbi:MAG: hypothetical protein KAU90_02350, partial [Sulfurovaceae bacterium]|nr:hypothetical protein [Sulfurovaceae bacterium]
KMIETNEGNQTKVSDKMSKLVDTIASKKAELTKAHLQCIIDVQNVLTKEQRKKVMAYATMKKENKAKVVTENNTTKTKSTTEKNSTK